MIKIITKILGFFLLAVGVTSMIYSLYASYNIFTAKTPVPEIFAVSANETVNPKTSSGSPQGLQDIQEQMQETIKQQMDKMLPSGSLPTLLNLVAWSIFAGILILGGGHISTVGIKLIKD